MESLTPWQAAVIVTAFSLATFANLISILRISSSLRSFLRGYKSSPQQLHHRYKRTFIALAIIQPTATTGTQATFAALSWISGGDWSVYLLASILLSSMVGEVSGADEPNARLTVLSASWEELHGPQETGHSVHSPFSRSWPSVRGWRVTYTAIWQWKPPFLAQRSRKA